MFGLLKTGIALTSGVGVAIAAIFGIFAPALIGIFSPDAEVVAAGITILRAVMFSLPFLGGTQLSTVTVQAMGKPVYALLLSISRQGILYIPLLLLLNTLGGFQGFIYAQAITDLLMLFVASVVLFFILKKDNANNEQIPLMYDGKMSTANYPKG